MCEWKRKITVKSQSSFSHTLTQLFLPLVLFSFELYYLWFCVCVCVCVEHMLVVVTNYVNKIKTHLFRHLVRVVAVAIHITSDISLLSMFIFSNNTIKWMIHLYSRERYISWFSPIAKKRRRRRRIQQVHLKSRSKISYRYEIGPISYEWEKEWKKERDLIPKVRGRDLKFKTRTKTHSVLAR